MFKTNEPGSWMTVGKLITLLKQIPEELMIQALVVGNLAVRDREGSFLGYVDVGNETMEMFPAQ